MPGEPCLPTQAAALFPQREAIRDEDNIHNSPLPAGGSALTGGGKAGTVSDRTCTLTRLPLLTLSLEQFFFSNAASLSPAPSAPGRQRRRTHWEPHRHTPALGCPAEAAAPAPTSDGNSEGS